MIHLTTNHHWRDIIHGYDLTAKERREFDYYEDGDELDCAMFIRYRNEVYDLSEFMPTSRLPAPLSDWHGHRCDSFSSGIAIRFDDACDQVQIATYRS